MGNLAFFENMINNKLLSLHTAYLAKVISTDGKTAKIQPLGMSKAYGKTAQAQSVLSNVPISANAVKFKEKTYSVVTSPYPNAKTSQITVLERIPIEKGDIVLCVCCERDITDAKNGKNSVPALGHHNMSDSVITSVLQ